MFFLMESSFALYLEKHLKIKFSEDIIPGLLELEFGGIRRRMDEERGFEDGVPNGQAMPL